MRHTAVIVVMWWFAVSFATSGAPTAKMDGHSRQWPTEAECWEQRGLHTVAMRNVDSAEIVWGAAGCTEVPTAMTAPSSLRQPTKPARKP